MSCLTRARPFRACAGAMTDAKPAEKYAWAVGLMRRIEAARSFAGRAFLRRPAWPPLPGAYCVGNSSASVAVCTLTDSCLMDQAARLPGVAIAGRVFTANLGLERIILNVTANPNIRFLLLCGRDSPLFKPGQTLKALLLNGLSPERRVIGAEGYLPILAPAASTLVERFRRQVELVDRTDEEDPAALETVIADLAVRNPGPLADYAPEASGELPRFRELRLGGHREPMTYDPRGFFVVNLDRKRHEITVHHYWPDNRPAHSIRGRGAEAIMLGLLREKLVSQLSHAAYLGGELAKAEAALRFGLEYEQDRKLRSSQQEQVDETDAT